MTTRRRCGALPRVSTRCRTAPISCPRVTRQHVSATPVERDESRSTGDELVEVGGTSPPCDALKNPRIGPGAASANDWLAYTAPARNTARTGCADRPATARFRSHRAGANSIGSRDRHGRSSASKRIGTRRRERARARAAVRRPRVRVRRYSDTRASSARKRAILEHRDRRNRAKVDRDRINEGADRRDADRKGSPRASCEALAAQAREHQKNKVDNGISALNWRAATHRRSSVLELDSASDIGIRSAAASSASRRLAARVPDPV